jgi:SAM-dependent methyltransferase
MVDSSTKPGETATRLTLSSQVRADITQRLDDIALTTLVSVSRIARVAVTDGGEEQLVVTVVLDNGHTSIPDRVYPAEQTVGVGVTAAAAVAVGDGTALLDDAYADGSLVLQRYIPDDFRLAPLLEALFEVLVEAGVLGRTETGYAPGANPALPGRLSAFVDVDGHAGAAELVSYLERSADPRQRVNDRLAARPGDRVLDVGCGAGHGLLDLAAKGVVAVGLDRSEAMARATRQRAAEQGQSVRVMRADCHALPFPAGSFDGCRVERVLQHIESPTIALAEIRRVLRPGGGIAVLEPDWESLAITSDRPAVSSAVVATNCAAHRHPSIGRQLAGLLTSAGFDGVQTWTDPVVWTSLRDLREIVPIDSLLHRAVTAGDVSAADRAAWLQEQEQRSQSGQFRAMLDCVIEFAPVTPEQ